MNALFYGWQYTRDWLIELNCNAQNQSMHIYYNKLLVFKVLSTATVISRLYTCYSNQKHYKMKKG